MNSDHNEYQAIRPEENKSPPLLPDPMEIVLEAAARLRVLERLLQYTLAPESASERHALVRRYNRLRRQLQACLAAVPTGRNGLPHERPVTTITGPLRQDSSDQIISAAVGSIHRLLEQLVIS